MTHNNEILTNYDDVKLPSFQDWLNFFVYAGIINERLNYERNRNKTN